MSDRDRILNRLRQGSLTSREIRAKGYSGNPSERIRELEAQGFEITTQDHRIGRRRFVTYTLVSEPPVGPGSAQSNGGPPASSADSARAVRSSRYATERPRMKRGRFALVCNFAQRDAEGKPRWVRMPWGEADDAELATLPTVDQALAEQFGEAA